MSSTSETRQFDFDDRGPAIVEPAVPVYSVQGTESRVSVPTGTTEGMSFRGIASAMEGQFIQYTTKNLVVYGLAK